MSPSPPHVSVKAPRGRYLPATRHNWFVSAAMTGADLALVLAATDQAFAAGHVGPASVPASRVVAATSRPGPARCHNHPPGKARPDGET